MANNAQKTPFARSLNDFAEKKTGDRQQVQGKRLPCQVTAVDGAIVTVKFLVNAAPFTLPTVTVPVATSIYARAPTQVGDLGYLEAADVRLGGVSGLGGGAPNLTTPANLTALVFEPLGNATWDASPDPDAYLLQGPNGVYLRDMGGESTLILTPNGIALVGKTTISMAVGNNASITITDGKVDIVGELTINGKKYLDHQHGGVTAGPPTTYSGAVHNP